MDASREAMKVHWAAFCRYPSLTDCSPRSSFGRCNQQCCLEEAGSQAACSLLLQEPVWRCSTLDQRREAAESWYWGKKDYFPDKSAPQNSSLYDCKEVYASLCEKQWKFGNQHEAWTKLFLSVVVKSLSQEKNTHLSLKRCLKSSASDSMQWKNDVQTGSMK